MIHRHPAPARGWLRGTMRIQTYHDSGPAGRLAADCRRYRGCTMFLAVPFTPTGYTSNVAGGKVAAPTLHNTFAPIVFATLKVSPRLISQGCALPASPVGKLLYRAFRYQVYRNVGAKGTRPSCKNCQLSIVNCQLGHNCQLSTVNCQLYPLPAYHNSKYFSTFLCNFCENLLYCSE